jgi:hypothetical protein
MLRMIKILLLAAFGAMAGVLLGVIAGLAFVEFGRHACTGAACADEIVRQFMPFGAIAGGLLGAFIARRAARSRGIVSVMLGRGNTTHWSA